jgi:hypothetical protein
LFPTLSPCIPSSSSQSWANRYQGTQNVPGLPGYQVTR